MEPAISADKKPWDLKKNPRAVALFGIVVHIGYGQRRGGVPVGTGVTAMGGSNRGQTDLCPYLDG
jgi:hypothetical protein